MFYSPDGWCSLPDCWEPHWAKSYCRRHYGRWRRNGDPLVDRRSHRAKPLAQRLVEHTERRPSGCLEWTGTVNRDGYGRLQVNGRYVLAHRVAWSLANGGADPGPQRVRHTCDNPPCCEGSHLIAGSQAENVADMMAKGRHRPRFSKES